MSAAKSRGIEGRRRKAGSSVDVILLKDSRLAFEFDLVTKKQRNGRLQIFLSVDRKENGTNDTLGADVLNNRSPDRVGLIALPRNLSMFERMSQVQ